MWGGGGGEGGGEDKKDSYPTRGVPHKRRVGSSSFRSIDRHTGHSVAFLEFNVCKRRGKNSSGTFLICGKKSWGLGAGMKNVFRLINRLKLVEILDEDVLVYHFKPPASVLIASNVATLFSPCAAKLVDKNSLDSEIYSLVLHPSSLFCPAFFFFFNPSLPRSPRLLSSLFPNEPCLLIV